MRRTHQYADGGKVVKDHLKEDAAPALRVTRTASPGIGGAIKDLIGSFARGTKTGATVDAKKRKSRLDQQIEDAGG